MRKHKESDQENYYKDAFRVFFKDESGCVPAEELKFIFRSLNVNCLKYFLNQWQWTLQIAAAEVDEMIDIVDKNGDGKISYSEFRVMLGAMPLIID